MMAIQYLSAWKDIKWCGEGGLRWRNDFVQRIETTLLLSNYPSNAFVDSHDPTPPPALALSHHDMASPLSWTRIGDNRDLTKQLEALHPPPVGRWIGFLSHKYIVLRYDMPPMSHFRTSLAADLWGYHHLLAPLRIPVDRPCHLLAHILLPLLSTIHRFIPC
ncbi:hypothetical protein BDZ94DRAFT_21507 [Collybia nuda]|uniref:Uncharacterized protein n=1 Tax=Collybia nuda TaxID=64659 RepID=A0A9P5YJD9_9AGAR|nr:hypothetical protein BDZ94DRAFT_21507 [Collybia nuda]